MRRLKLQMQVSLDGYNSTGPDDEQQWVTWDLDGIRQHVVDLFDASDTIVLGRKLAVDYIPFWERTVQDPAHPMHDFATRIVRARKIVFTKTLPESTWENAELAKGELSDEIRRLKSQPGEDIMAYGGSSFVAALVREGLVDEYHLFVNPIAIGRGTSAFRDVEQWQSLTLKKAVPFPSGIVLLHYEKA